MRNWRVGKALESFAALNEVLSSLTEDEVFAALETESRALRRPTIIERLIGRAVRLKELAYSKELKEKYMAHTPSKIMNAKLPAAPKKTPAKKTAAKKVPAKKAKK